MIGSTFSVLETPAQPPAPPVAQAIAATVPVGAARAPVRRPVKIARTSPADTLGPALFLPETPADHPVDPVDVGRTADDVGLSQEKSTTGAAGALLPNALRLQQEMEAMLKHFANIEALYADLQRTQRTPDDGSRDGLSKEAEPCATPAGASASVTRTIPTVRQDADVPFDSLDGTPASSCLCSAFVYRGPSSLRGTGPCKAWAQPQSQQGLTRNATRVVEG